MHEGSIWRQTAETRRYERLSGDIEADVAIVGGGITGLTLAHELARAGKKAVVLEAETFGYGTTGHSSCHLTTQIGFSYESVEKKFDGTTAKIVADSRLRGIEYIEMKAKEGIACDFQRVPGYLYAEKAAKAKELEKEAEAAKAAGLDVNLVNSAPLPFARPKALRFENQAIFNSQSYLLGLARSLEGTSCVLYEKSRVVKVDDDGKRVRTEFGSVKAEHTVMATHLPPFINLLQTLAAPYRSYVLGVTLRSDSIPNALYWDNEDPYHYTRLYEKGGRKWLVVGGADHKTGHNPADPDPFAELENYVYARYPVASVDYKWSAQYYEPSDGLPYIGLSPFENVYVATGFSGDGLVYGTVAGLLLADLLQGRSNNWSDAYNARRITPRASGAHFVRENADVAKHLVWDRIRGTKELDQIEPGQGAVIALDGKRLAVSCGVEGDWAAVSPICPHMGCVLQWNGSETTWDCPCHGSRFRRTGELLEGPSEVSLKSENEVLAKTATAKR